MLPGKIHEGALKNEWHRRSQDVGAAEVYPLSVPTGNSGTWIALQSCSTFKKDPRLFHPHIYQLLAVGCHLVGTEGDRKHTSQAFLD